MISGVIAPHASETTTGLSPVDTQCHHPRVGSSSATEGERPAPPRYSSCTASTPPLPPNQGAIPLMISPVAVTCLHACMHAPESDAKGRSFAAHHHPTQSGVAALLPRWSRERRRQLWRADCFMLAALSALRQSRAPAREAPTRHCYSLSPESLAWYLWRERVWSSVISYVTPATKSVIGRR